MRERSALRYLRFWGPRARADVDEELRFHLEMRAREYAARGMSEAEARAAAARRLGDLDAARAQCVTITTRRNRRMARAHLIDALAQDVRFALRTLGRRKGWTAVAVLTLALGIGANTAVFSVVNSLLLHPLPYPDADRIVLVFQQPSEGNRTGINVTITPAAPIVRLWREHARAFEALEPWTAQDATLLPAGGEPATVRAATILPSFARFAGQRPLLGRAFVDDDLRDGGHVLLLGEGLWRSRYGADPDVVGRTLTIDGVPRTVVGVMPATLVVPELSAGTADVWLPLDLRDDHAGFSLIGRLRPGVPRAQAVQELEALERHSPSGAKRASRFTTVLAAPGETLGFRGSLVLLAGAVALVLLIACANVAHLLLARAATRQREMAIRSSLGAGRSRLGRQLLTESLVLCAAGCAGGLAIGWLGLRAMLALRPESLGELGAVRMDGAVFGVALALAVLTAVLFGLVGAVQAARYSSHEALKAGASGSSYTRRQHRLRGLLVGSEMALSTTLLVAATLLVRSVIHLQSRDPGFVPTGLYTIRLPLPADGTRNPAGRAALATTFAERARRLPGVEAVTITNTPPPWRSFRIGALQAEGEPEPPKGTTALINQSGIEPEFFRTMGMRLVQGTTLTDTSAARGEVVINEGLARAAWPGRSAVGRRLRIVFNGQGDWLTVVGVVADASTGGLMMDAAAPMLYLPVAPQSQLVALVRVRPDAHPLPALRALAAQLDASAPPPAIGSVEEVMAKSIARPRFTMALLVAFTSLALVLAAVGLYGVLSYMVAQRTREIGIRIALGATRGAIARAVVSQGAALAVAGALVGLAGAWWATRLLGGLLYGVSRTDPLSFTAGAAALLATAMVACLVPVRRAMRVDPAIAMRAE